GIEDVELLERPDRLLASGDEQARSDRRRANTTARSRRIGHRLPAVRRWVVALEDGEVLEDRKSAPTHRTDASADRGGGKMIARRRHRRDLTPALVAEESERPCDRDAVHVATKNVKARRPGRVDSGGHRVIDRDWIARTRGPPIGDICLDHVPAAEPADYVDDAPKDRRGDLAARCRDVRNASPGRSRNRCRRRRTERKRAVGLCLDRYARRKDDRRSQRKAHHSPRYRCG